MFYESRIGKRILKLTSFFSSKQQNVVVTERVQLQQEMQNM